MRLIDSDAAIEVMNRCIENPESKLHEMLYEYTKRFLIKCETVDAEPVRHGHWIDKNPFYKNFAQAIYVCSECGRAVEHFQCKTVTEQYPYCHCGAKMDEEVKP